LLVELLEKRRATLGDSHPDTLRALEKLANLYTKQGKYDLSEPLLVEGLEKQRATLGDTHPDTL
jgi:hypothetical protein